jgi:hypothetical protein
VVFPGLAWPPFVTQDEPDWLETLASALESERQNMSVRLWTVAAIVWWTASVATQAAADEGKPAPAISFDRDARPILRKRCASCHNAERARGELDLTSHAGVLAGGVSGKAVVAGSPEESPVYTQAAHLEEPHMPPNAPRIPLREIDLLRRWIEQGLVEKAGDAQTIASAKSPGALPRESRSGPAAGMVSTMVPARATAVSALAVSPAAPLVAVSGHKQVLVFDWNARKLQGALAFPEGDVFALGFSRDGRSLLAAGGIGAESGRAVLFETTTWSRTASIGDELDAVLAAGLSPDTTRVVLGGPTRLVKVFSNPGGEILHTFRKPTDWVTAATFSPDGLLTAAGDRFGGLFLWETRSGSEFLTLRGHTKAITAIAWLAKTDSLVTAGEDGTVRVWDLHTGKVSSRWDAHPEGVLAVDVHASGRIASAGRDRRVKVWEPDGRLVADLGPTADQATRVAWTAYAHSLISGDCSGELRLWNLADSTSIRLPSPVASKGATVALIEPVLSPARPGSPLLPARAPTPSRADRIATSRSTAEDLEAALASARSAAAAAENTVAELSRLANSRSPSPGRSVSALDAARSALRSLRAALAAEPGDAALIRAVEETERAVRLLEQRRARPGSSANSH